MFGKIRIKSSLQRLPFDFVAILTKITDMTDRPVIKTAGINDLIKRGKVSYCASEAKAAPRKALQQLSAKREGSEWMDGKKVCSLGVLLLLSFVFYT